MNISGIDLEKLGNEIPRIASAGAVVELGNQVANLLKRLRIESEFSQADMAAKLGVSQPRIAQLESGKPDNLPSLEQIAEYAFYCGRSVTISEVVRERVKA
jgi:transcriptional regulator with XRE-family HTH domain